jgi:hypothetical protein
VGVADGDRGASAAVRGRRINGREAASVAEVLRKVRRVEVFMKRRGGVETEIEEPRNTRIHEKDDALSMELSLWVAR